MTLKQHRNFSGGKMKFAPVLVLALSIFASGQFAEARGRSCKKSECAVQITVSRAEQTLTLKAEGISEKWRVSTGRPGMATPSLETNPDGRMYNDYVMSVGTLRVKHVVFLRGGFAIFGVTSRAQENKLGQAVSYGGIRLDLKNAALLQDVVKSYGVNNTWVSIR
jgi:lipoprotein-anchoring transpeptidase ErfK/SrfK